MTALVINLFAGPGAGKSTTASKVFAGLKDRGVSAELALEFAKELTWEKRYGAMACQPYLFGEQLYRVQRLVDNPGVEAVVTDSPLLLSIVYGDTPYEFREGVIRYVQRFDRLNFFLDRVKPYDPRGRRQSEDSARQVDSEVRDALHTAGEDYDTVLGDDSGAEFIIAKTLGHLGRCPF